MTILNTTRSLAGWRSRQASKVWGNPNFPQRLVHFYHIRLCHPCRRPVFKATCMYLISIEGWQVAVWQGWDLNSWPFRTSPPSFWHPDIFCKLMHTLYGATFSDDVFRIGIHRYCLWNSLIGMNRRLHRWRVQMFSKDCILHSQCCSRCWCVLCGGGGGIRRCFLDLTHSGVMDGALWLEARKSENEEDERREIGSSLAGDERRKQMKRRWRNGKERADVARCCLISFFFFLTIYRVVCEGHTTRKHSGRWPYGNNLQNALCLGVSAARTWCIWLGFLSGVLKLWSSASHFFSSLIYRAYRG